MSSAQTEVRSALAAYIEGATQLPVFEQWVARLLAGRGSVRGIIQSELKAAVADGTLPPESLRRLGLADTPPPASFESADTGSDWADNRPSTPQIAQCGGLLGNRYRLERILGEGGTGVVFLAVDQEVRGDMFAVKVLRPEMRANPESWRLLREEVRRTRALRHPHIVGVYSLNSDPSGVYMLMEYLEGKSLKTVLDEEFGRGMPLIRAWPMIHDVGAALAYAHDHNVIHSDIKPSNVMITSSGSYKLLDFGIARADRNRTNTRDAAAIDALTPAYACCEMFEGRAPDQSDDVYAFACVIYEMLTGRHPYGRMAAVEARARKLQPAPIKVLTNRQNAALARALEFDRERRTESVEILLEGLKGMASNRPDRRAWVTSGAAVAAVFAVSSGWLWENHNAHRESAADLRPTAAPAPTPSPEPNPTGTLDANDGAAPAAAIVAAFASPPIPSAESQPLPPTGVAITGAATKEEIDRPPFGKKVPGVVATTESQSKMQSEEYCPYPAEAREEVQTGTVVMLVYVTPDGTAANAELDQAGSSGSSVLDQSAVKCVRDVGRFPVKLAGSKPVGYWARTKFVWSFGG